MKKFQDEFERLAAIVTALIELEGKETLEHGPFHPNELAFLLAEVITEKAALWERLDYLPELHEHRRTLERIFNELLELDRLAPQEFDTTETLGLYSVARAAELEARELVGVFLEA